MIPNDVRPSAVRKYLYEYVLIALCGCVVFLFFSFNSLNEFIRDELTKQRLELMRTVEYNTNTIQQFLNYQKQKQNERIIEPLTRDFNSSGSYFKSYPYKRELFTRPQNIAGVDFFK